MDKPKGKELHSDSKLNTPPANSIPTDITVPAEQFLNKIGEKPVKEDQQPVGEKKSNNWVWILVVVIVVVILLMLVAYAKRKKEDQANG